MIVFRFLVGLLAAFFFLVATILLVALGACLELAGKLAPEEKHTGPQLHEENE